MNASEISIFHAPVEAIGSGKDARIEGSFKSISRGLNSTICFTVGPLWMSLLFLADSPEVGHRADGILKVLLKLPQPFMVPLRVRSDNLLERVYLHEPCNQVAFYSTCSLKGHLL